MARSSKKTVETILAVASATTTTTKEDFEVQRKITLATEGFTTTKFCELILRDRSRLSKESALTISEYIIAMKREVNPRLSYIKYTIQFLYELSKSVGVEKQFEDMTREDILLYLYSNRKSENDDPLHKWIGSYNTKRITLIRFFKSLYYPNVNSPKMSFEGYQEALESQKHKEDEIKDMKVQFNTMQSMLEKLIAGLSKTSDQQQFNTMTQSLLSSGVLKVAAPSSVSASS